MPGIPQQVPIAPGTPSFDPTQGGQQAFFNASLQAAQPPPMPAVAGPQEPPPSALPQQIPIAPGTPSFDPTQGGQQLLSQFAQPSAQAPAAPIVTNPFLRESQERAEEQAKLEAEHGKLATFGLQAARGALNVVLLAPALVGAGAEGAGKLTGWRGLEDFGRQYGEASNGREALATLFSDAGVQAARSAFGAENKPSEALESYNKSRETIEGQAEAWPLLSTIARVSGGVALSFGVAGLARAGASAAVGEGGAEAAEGAEAVRTLGQTALGAAKTGALEGAEGGAQSAYETGRPYRDVVGSTLMGGILGAATAATAASGAYLLEHAEPKEALESFARNRVFKAIGGLKSDVRKVGGVEDADRIADDLTKTPLSDGETVLPKSVFKAAGTSLDDIRERVAMGRNEFGDKLATMQQQVGTFLDEHARNALPKAAFIREKLAEIAEPLEKSSMLAPQATPIRGLIDDIDKATREDGTIGLSDLIQIKRNLYKAISPSGDALPATKEAIDRAGGTLAGYINDVADAGAVKMGAADAGAYKELNRVARSFIQADKVINRGVAGQYGNRGISLTDSITGAAAFGADLAGGGGLMSAAKGLAAAAVHKFARERGSQIMAALAEKLAESPGRIERAFENAARYIDKSGEIGIGTEAESLAGQAEEADALEKRIGVVGGTLGGQLLRDLGWHDNRDSRIVSVRDAGGREAQSVIAELGRAKEKIERESNAAGDNPLARQAAQQSATERLSSALALKAGPYAPVDWQHDAPSPLQKVVYRSELLDHSSADVVKASAALADSKPQAPALTLDDARVRKLAKDANGPLAIGNVQQALNQTIQNASSPAVQGAAMQALQQVNAADDAAQTFQHGHTFLQTLAQMYGYADAPTRADIDIAAQSTKKALSDVSFGKAGQIYSKLQAPADASSVQLLDQQAVRVALQNATAPGQLQAVATALAKSVQDAHDAAAQLTGDKTTEAAQQAKDLVKLVNKAEQAALLDGGPAGRVFDFFRKDRQLTAPRDAPQFAVLNAVRPQIEKLMPALGKEPEERYTGAPKATAIKALPKTQADLNTLYNERIQDLANYQQKAADPATLTQAFRHSPNVDPQTVAAIGTEANQRIAQLLNDMPKPKQTLRGKSGLSGSELRRADAMYEATFAPMSIFDDFKHGTVDYEKTQYVWKQYPGLQQAAQAGVIDVLHTHLDENERASVPDPMLTQIDYLLGFKGALQTSVDRNFAAQMTAAAQQEQQQRKPSGGGQLDLPNSNPTFTERLVEAKRK